ncbi:MAG: UDP-N-acetylmuramate dehydrogenase [Acidobacteria bacterium]|nr:MAG: UDP-N-acetylmuramate dehydrogenase [Acidobacteriota bacterium]
MRSSAAPDPPLPLAEQVPFAELTTLGVGGPARYLARCPDVPALVAALELAERRSLPFFVLGGGSNLLVADRGYDGLVARLDDRTLSWRDEGGWVRVAAAAGVPWDELVTRAVARGLGGLECLSGIPGLVGAAPIQNVGAYGQEVAESIADVDVVERRSGRRRRIAAAHCGFAYRHSHFKGRWRQRYVVTRVSFRLPRTDRGTLRYADLEERFAGRDGPPPTPAEVRAAVLEVRRAKSMVIEAGDPNRRSAGSFFVNPQVTAERAAEVRQIARRRGVARPMPAFPAADGRLKIAAAWLIEAAGFRRGYRRGRAAISSRHALALVNLGGARAAEIVGLAREIRCRVREVFGVTLAPEPVFLGFDREVDELLG